MHKVSIRQLCLVGLLLCVLSLGFALYLQIFEQQQPCILCVFQRISLMISGLLFLTAVIQVPKTWGKYLYAIFLFLSSLWGLSMAGRQVYLQMHPDSQTTACGPAFGELFKIMPWNQALITLLKGNGDCALVTWRFLNLSLASWSIALFIILIGLSILLWFKQANNTMH